MLDLLGQIKKFFARPRKDAREEFPPPSGEGAERVSLLYERPRHIGPPERSFSTAELRRRETDRLCVKGTQFLGPLDIQELEARGYMPRARRKEN